MSSEKQREIASKGGRAAHQKGTAHEWSSDEAREAGRKGGMASRGGRGKLPVVTSDTSPVASLEPDRPDRTRCVGQPAPASSGTRRQVEDQGCGVLRPHSSFNLQAVTNLPSSTSQFSRPARVRR